MGATVFKQHCDCVVMLTFSDWYTEPVSNRYHYATRLSQTVPVLFVQPDLLTSCYRFQTTEVPGITVLHVFRTFGRGQTELINLALLEKNFISPMLWMYNFEFIDFYRTRFSPLRVYHATEDIYLYTCRNASFLNQIISALTCTDLLVSVSKRVEENYLANTQYIGRRILLENGCDYKFWGLTEEEVKRLAYTEPQKCVLYQGGIKDWLNYELLIELCLMMPDWRFIFCGRISCVKTINLERIAKLKRLRNTCFTGQLSVAQLREHALDASIGLIPFLDVDLMHVSFPLKSFEYTANGLPVITTCRIDSLNEFGDLFTVCEEAKDVKSAIERLYLTRYIRDEICTRLSAAKKVSYDIRFEQGMQEISKILLESANISTKRNIIHLIDNNALSMSKNAFEDKEYLSSIYKHMDHHSVFAHATGKAKCLLDINAFDTLMISNSVKVTENDLMSRSFEKAVMKFGGYKVLFVQYDHAYAERIRQVITRLGIHLVFTDVSPKNIQTEYPLERFPFVKIVSILGGKILDNDITDDKANTDAHSSTSMHLVEGNSTDSKKQTLSQNFYIEFAELVSLSLQKNPICKHSVEVILPLTRPRNSIKGWLVYTIGRKLKAYPQLYYIALRSWRKINNSFQDNT